MADNGKLIIKIDGDTGALKSTLSGVGNVASKSLGFAVKGVAAIGSAFTAASGAALKFSGDLEQNIGGSQAVFEKFAGVVQNKAETAFKTAGLSVSDFLATANKMGSLFQGTGFEVEKSADMATDAIQRAADVASIMGVDINFAMESVAGMAKGNFTMMDNLGVAMNDTTLKAYAQQKGLGELKTTYDKVNVAMQMFMEKTEKYAGNYEKENKTIAGAINTAKAAIQNFMAGTGTVDDLAYALQNAAEVVIENLGGLAPKLADGFEELIKQMIPLLPSMAEKLIPPIVSTIEELFYEAIGIIPELIMAIATGVGDAVPVMQPLTDLIVLLTNNLDVLAAVTAAGTTSVIAYNAALTGMSIIQQIRAWLSTTKVALTAYNAALVANSAMTTRGITVNSLLLSTLTPLQVAYGVLTGKITLADAAQKLFNSTLLKNPYALALAAVAALTAAVVTYSITHKSASDKIVDSLEDIKKSHEDAIKSAGNMQKEELAEAEIAKTLKNHLYELEEQINSGTLSQEEAKEVQDDFNVSANKLNEIIPGIITSLYDETGAIDIQKISVDNLVDSYYDLAVAKATAVAAEQKMQETAKALIDAKQIQKEAQDNYDASQKNAMTILFKAGPAYNALKEANKTVEQLEKDQEDFKTLWVDAQKKVENAMSGIVDTTKKGVKKTSDYISSGNTANTASTKNAAKTQSKSVEEAYEKELRDLKFNRDIGKITEAEYYADLEKYRDKYFKAGSEEWQQYTVDIYNYQKRILEEQKKETQKLYDEITDYALEKIGEVEKKQESYSKKLSSYGSLFNKNIIEFGEETIEYYSLADIDRDIEAISAYNDKMLSFKNILSDMGVSDKTASAYLEEINSLSVDEGSKVLDALLKTDKNKLSEYLGEFDKKHAYSEGAAATYYFDDMAQAATDAYQNMVDKLNEAGFDVPEGWTASGTLSAKNYGEAFITEIDKQLATISAKIDATLAKFQKMRSLGINNNAGTVYQDNRQSSFIVTVQSERQAYEIKKANDQYEAHTSSV